jgi:predicted metalloprotease with PDZ domain
MAFFPVAKLLLAALVFTTGQVRTTTPALDLAYNLSFSKPATHLYEVVFEIGNIRQAAIDLQMPAWTPGSYLVREYARNVQDFEALDESGRPLKWTKKDKATWQIETGATSRLRKVRARYSVYANELPVRTSHLDSTHAYFNPASLFMYVKGEIDKPLRLKIDAPQGWKVTSPLALAPDADGYFRAPNYDILVDSPHEVGTHRLLEFSVLGKPHRIAIWGDTNVDTRQLTNDVTKMIEQAAAIFGGLPYEH